MSIPPFFIEKLDDSFLQVGLKQFLKENAESADITIERVYENEKYNITHLVIERELKVILTNEVSK